MGRKRTDRIDDDFEAESETCHGRIETHSNVGGR